MPPDEIILTIVNLSLIGLSLFVFVCFLTTGRLSEKHLRLGPTRDLHQPPLVYLIAIIGTSVYSLVMLTVVIEHALVMQLMLFNELLRLTLIALLVNRALHAEAGFRKVGLVPRWPVRDCAWGIGGGLVSLGLAGAVGMLINFILAQLGHTIDSVAHESLQQLRDEFSMELLMGLIISAVILAPLLEEILYRGIFQTSLLRVFRGRRWPALIIASAVFAVIHLSVTPWHGLIMLFVVGLVFGYVYERTGSLLTPILAHAVFNAANIALLLSMPEQAS
ncbi:MAG: CPBP family intramembrane glutamic endopeptidase [Planctomycetota bacterium]